MIPLRVTFSLGGPFATPWHADTIAGHLLWATLRMEGTDMLRVLIDDALEGDPAFVISDGFPCDMLPFPVLPLPAPRPGLSYKERREAFKQGWRLRELRRRGPVSREDFQRLVGGVLPDETEKGQSWLLERTVLKNQLSRLTGTTGEEGQLFSFRERWLNDRSPSVTVYALVREEDESLFRELVAEFARTGYGKRKSAGYGSIRSHSVESFCGFDVTGEPDGFVSLSTFVPAPDDPTDGQWEVLIKRGKLGEELAAGHNPFKRPLIMLRAGATFRAAALREFYGTVVTGVAPDVAPEVVQWAFAYPVPVRFPAEEVRT